ncbi:MAG: hypothetical protein A2X36_08045 [Elusimicrobia bacterium GWA2_69_24]|nr:MAG: hypothetical protein A2X36_08045 [Elusimicrobia bacterium GWA2_69_24]HBL17447.1 hypothetical protein [Elusimicrobiota bacterium]
MADEPTFGGNGGNPGFDHIAIPDLKKKQKEKKGTGAAVTANAPAAGNPVGAALQGASSGGLQAGAAGIGASAGAAGVSASGGLAGFAALLGSKIGIAAIALALAGAGFVGYTALKMGQSQGQKPGSPQLGGLSSDIKIAKRDAEGSRSLDMMAKTSKGEIDWDSVPGAGAKKDAAKKSDEAAEVDAAAKAADEGAPAPEAFPEKQDRARLTGELSGSKLSSSLGGSTFGGHDIFGKGGTGFKPTGLANMSKSGGNLASAANKGGKLGTPRGQLGKMKGSRGLMARNINTRNAQSGNALGQAKFADGMSKAGAAASSETDQRNMSADAFDGQSTTGGESSGIGGGSSGGGGTAATLGEGAPEGDVWSDDDYTGTGYTAPSVTYTGDQNTKDTGLIDAMKTLMEVSVMLILIGSALVLIGEAMDWCPCVGEIIAGIGRILCGVAMALGAVIAVLAAFMGDSQMIAAWLGVGVIVVAGGAAGMAGGGWGVLALVMSALYTFMGDSNEKQDGTTTS